MGTLRQLSLGDLADDGRREEEEREREIMPSLMATSLRWRTHSARTKTLAPLYTAMQYTVIFQFKPFKRYTNNTATLFVFDI